MGEEIALEGLHPGGGGGVPEAVVGLEFGEAVGTVVGLGESGEGGGGSVLVF